ncbi:HAD family phosphatase [Lacibacter luteus]|uniref:HAD family phosphatase n=1 Tax=Lacibacter luteus TaxID=2508719 RepID=A0A4V1M7Y5_9BACT|nr:HAD family phosphatase [Lacibacter luteus]RXK61972.1 HAD family phosphatase [Lacibacter luteus]
MQKAFLFDLNGTMIDDMEYHIRAWHSILNGLGAHLTYEETKLQCYGKNHELLERTFPGRFTLAEKDAMSVEKEKQYQQAFGPHLKLIDGLDVLMNEAKQANIPMAIGSAAIMFNIDFVLDGLDLRSYISAVVSADDVTISKPHPETFLKCAEKLGVAPADCIVFEDSPKGVEAAAAAGMKAVVITTMHEEHEFAVYNNIIGFIKDYSSLSLSSL